MSKKNYADIWNVFPKCVCGAACSANRKASSTNRKASSENWKVSSEEAEGFFQRALGSYTHTFPKHGAALLTDPLELCLCPLSCAFNGKAEQQWKGFHKRVSFLKRCTAYGIYSWEAQGSNLHVSIPFFLNSFWLQREHDHSNLFKHPLVISLLEYKWTTFGRYIFFGNLFIYLIFLTFLTAFGLVVLSPLEKTC